MFSCDIGYYAFQFEWSHHSNHWATRLQDGYREWQRHKYVTQAMRLTISITFIVSLKHIEIDQDLAAKVPLGFVAALVWSKPL